MGARTTPSPPLDDRINILQNGASDGFCVSTESFTQRQSKIEFEEVMFSKGNMFSIQENDFQVPKSGFYNFQISFETDLCGALSLCGPTEVSIRKNQRVERSLARNLATDSTRDMDFVSASFLIDCGRNDKIDIFLDDYFGEGLQNVLFCGFYVGS